MHTFFKKVCVAKDDMEEFSHCASCRRFVVRSCDACSVCGDVTRNITTVREGDGRRPIGWPGSGSSSSIAPMPFPKVSLPVPIPVMAIPSRLDSPHLTPNVPYLSDYCITQLTPESARRRWAVATAADDDDSDEDLEYELAVRASIEDASSPGVRPADPGLLGSMRRFVYGDAAPDGARSPSPSPPELQLPPPMITPGVSPTPPSCPICLEDLERGEDVVRTGCCRKIAHHGCMESTLCVIPSCPFCRRTMAAAAGVVRTSSR